MVVLCAARLKRLYSTFIYFYLSAGMKLVLIGSNWTSHARVCGRDGRGPQVLGPSPHGRSWLRLRFKL